MSWIFIALLAYFFLAFANLIDKFLVDNIVKSSRFYTFIVCSMGLLSFLIAPWFLSWSGFSWFLFYLLSGALFALALLFLYESLKKGEASRTIIIIGGTTPIFSLFFSWLLWGQILDKDQLIGFLFLLIGIFIIAFLPIKYSFLNRLLIKINFKKDKKYNGIFIAVLSGLFYSLHFISSKHAYNNQEFLNVFLWTRLGAFLLVLFFLLNKKNRENIIKIFRKKKSKKKQIKKGALVVFNQILGSSGFILQNYAISLGSVAIINALQGFQYALIIVFSAIGSIFIPKLANENFSYKTIIQKSLGIVFIIFGLFFVSN
jgi:drug/metabolite transporter (DMT)-like permease